MKIVVKLIVAALLIAVIAGITIPLLNIRKIQSAISSADSSVESAVNLDGAIASLRRAERNVYSFPVLAHNLNVSLISAYTAAGEIEKATERAEWLRTTAGMATGYGVFAPRPSGPLATFLEQPNQWCYQIAARGQSQAGRFSWDRWIGYRTMLVQLDTDSTKSEYAELSRTIEELDTDGTFPRQLIKTTDVKGAEHKEIARNLHNLRVYDRKIAETQESDPEENTDFVVDREKATREAVPAWGVVKVPSANLFSIQAADEGRSLRVGEIPAGTLVEISKIFAPRSMTLAVCRMANGQHKGKQAIIKYETLAAFPGPIADAGEREQALQSAKVRLLLRIDALKDSARQRKKNIPAVRKYLEAEKKHKAFYAESKKLLAIMEGEVPGNVDKARDQLRQRKYDQDRIDKEFRRAKELYLHWRENRQERDDDPELAKVRQQLEEVRQELESLGAS